MAKFVYNDDKELINTEELNKKDESNDDDKEVTYTDYWKWRDINYLRNCIIYNEEIDPKTTIAYARVSSKKQVIENQVTLFKELGIPIVFADIASGYRLKAMDRRDFQEMMRYLDRHPHIRTLIVFEISRIGRNMADSVATFAELEKERGIRIISLTEPWTHMIDEDNRPLMISIFSWMNEMESKRISRRTKIGMERAVKANPARIPGRRPKVYFMRDFVENLRKRGWTWDEIAHHRDIQCDTSTLHKTRREWRKDDLGRESHLQKYKAAVENNQRKK